jgi:hypothetical protein
MEGGMALEEALAWAQGKTAKNILELPISLEADTYNCYFFMNIEIKEESSARVFMV